MVEKNYTKLFWVSSIILLLSLLLSYLMSISSFEDFYENSITTKYKLVSQEIKISIENSVNFGKPIDKYNGMNELLLSYIDKEKDIKNIFITLPSGQVIYSYMDSYNGKKLINKLIIPFTSTDENKVILENSEYFIISPVFYKNENFVGNVYIEFNKSLIKDKIEKMVEKSRRILAYVSILGILFLFITIKALKIYHNKKMNNLDILSKLNFATIISILIFSNLSYTYFNTIRFNNDYLGVINSNIDYFSKSITSEIDYFLNLGIPLDRLKGLEKLIYKKMKEIPECKNIIITDNQSNILYSSSQEGLLTSKYFANYKKDSFDIKNMETEYNKLYPIKSKSQIIGNAIFVLNKEYIRSKKIDLFFDSLTVLVVSVIICFQMLIMTSIFTRKNNVKEESPDTKFKIIKIKRDSKNNLKIIQIAAFIFYFGEMITLSFIPILGNKLYLNNPFSIGTLSKDTIASLPISAYMCGAAIFVLLIGYMSESYSERYIFVSCAILLTMGSIGAAITDSFLFFTFFRFISGLGYGGISINSTNYILKNTEEKEVASGFGYWTAGYAAASICAIPIGGVIVFRFGYMIAILTSTVCSILFLIFIIVSMYTQNEPPKKQIKKEVIKIRDLIGIFNDRNIVVNMLCTIVPFQFVYVGVFQYLLPLYMNEEGISQANIGRILTIFGVVYLFIPLVSKYVDKTNNDKIFIGMGNIIIGLFLLLFLYSNTTLIIVIVIIGMSIGSMIGDAAEESFVTSTKKAKEIGGAKLMGIYSSYERVVMIFVPILAGALLNKTGYSKSIIIIGGTVIILAFIFIFFSKNIKRGE